MALTNYWWLLIWIFAAGVIMAVVVPKQKKIVCGKMEYRWGWISAFALFLPYIIWAGFRSSSVGDTYAYEMMYKGIPNSIGALLNYLPTVKKDTGFTVLGGIIKVLFGDNTIIYFMILALIQGVILVYIYRKYSTNYLLSIFLFIASTDYISWMFNGIRQFTAVTIIFAATPLMLKKKWVPLIFTIVLASTIHGSALLMIPVVFLVQGKAWNKKTLAFMLLCIVALVFADQFTDILDTLLSDTQYTNVVSDWKDLNDDGTNIIRVLVYAIPTIMSFFGRKWLDEKQEPIINMSINMSIISTAIFLVSNRTSGVFVGRLPIFVSLYNYILMPYLIDQMFTKESARIVKMLMIIGYIGFFYSQVHFSWALI